MCQGGRGSRCLEGMFSPRISQQSSGGRRNRIQPCWIPNLWLFRWAGLHLLSTAPLNGSELRVKYLLQLLLPCPNHSSSVKYNFVALNIAQIYSSSCSFRLLVAGCWGEQCAARSSQRLQEGAVVEPIFQRNGFVSDTGCLGHLRNVCYH